MDAPTKLNPCPVCGGKAVLYGTDYKYVYCPKCDIRTIDYVRDEDAIARWNTRHEAAKETYQSGWPCKQISVEELLAKHQPDDCRAAFEAWYTCPDENKRALRRSETNPDGYALMQVQLSWTAWKAAWKPKRESSDGDLLYALEIALKHLAKLPLEEITAASVKDINFMERTLSKAKARYEQIEGDAS